MSDFEEKLNSILSDPARMEQITAMAKSLMGEQAAGEKAAPLPKKQSAAGEGLDPALLGRLGAAMSSVQGRDNKQALLQAMKPYLSSRRQEKLERAMKLAKMIHMAELAFGMFGGEGDTKI